MVDRLRLRRCLLLPVLLLCTACASTPDAVPPSQGGFLNRPEMAWDPGLTEEGAVRSQTYASKEAASGGPSLGSGGCGCY